MRTVKINPLGKIKPRRPSLFWFFEKKNKLHFYTLQYCGFIVTLSVKDAYGILQLNPAPAVV